MRQIGHKPDPMHTAKYIHKGNQMQLVLQYLSLDGEFEVRCDGAPVAMTLAVVDGVDTDA